MATELARTSVNATTMNAIVCTKPGRPSDLTLDEIEKPAVASDGLLIRVRASSINPVDFFPMTRVAYTARWLSGRGRAKPETLGSDFAGTVEAVGEKVTQFKPGDDVFGGRKGAFAEYVAMPESGPAVRKPIEVSFEQAAALPVAAITALQAVRDHGRVQPGQKVLVNGGSGGVGSYTVQLARLFGAEVTAVCSSRNLDRARSSGAARVIDYATEDFTRSEERYDVLLDIAGSHSWADSIRVLKPKGVYVLVGASTHTVFGGNRTIGHILRMRLSSLFSDRRFAFFIARLNKQDLTFLGDLIASGKLTSVIDRHYNLDQVPEAMAYMGEGHARGKIVVRV